MGTFALSVMWFIAAMTDYVYLKFPQYTSAIHALMVSNAAFYEACSNYEEICTWLATRKRRPIVEDPGELDQARELKRDLEDEILDLLENRSDIIE